MRIFIYTHVSKTVELRYTVYTFILRLFYQQAENTKFRDRQDRQTGEHIILLVHNKHKLLTLRNTKRFTLHLTKLKLYGAKNLK